jgi:hypothetical protein
MGLVARALSGHFERVTVLERDDLPDSAAPRKGVPQAAHGHGLLASGYRVLDDCALSHCASTLRRASLLPR